MRNNIFRKFPRVNTELCINLKTKLQTDARMKPGKKYLGVLKLDAGNTEEGYEDRHCTFIETLPSTTGKRNPHVFVGEYITMTRCDDGCPRFNFRPMKAVRDLSPEGYAQAVANEIVQGLNGLVEKEGGAG